MLPSEIGVFVRTREQLARARAAVDRAGQTSFELSEGHDAAGDRVSVGTMHLAKGLEFRAVVVMACDDDLLPLAARIETVADEVELDTVYETERQLFYVACTRARDRLMASGVAPGSEFLGDLRAKRGGTDRDRNCRKGQFSLAKGRTEPRSKRHPRRSFFWRRSREGSAYPSLPHQD